MTKDRINVNDMRWLTVVALLFFVAVQVYSIFTSDGRVRSIVITFGTTITMFAIASGALPGGKSDGVGFVGKIFIGVGIAVSILALAFIDPSLRIAFK